LPHLLGPALSPDHPHMLSLLRSIFMEAESTGTGMLSWSDLWSWMVTHIPVLRSDEADVSQKKTRTKSAAAAAADHIIFECSDIFPPKERAYLNVLRHISRPIGLYRPPRASLEHIYSDSDDEEEEYN
jgi:hypothetical protein